MEINGGNKGIGGCFITVSPLFAGVRCDKVGVEPFRAVYNRRIMFVQLIVTTQRQAEAIAK